MRGWVWGTTKEMSMSDTATLGEIEDLAAEPTAENLEHILEILMAEFDAERACLWRRNDKLIYLGEENLRLKFPFSRSALDSVLESGRGLISFNASGDSRLASESLAFHGVRSVLCAPVRDDKGEVVAIFYFDNQVSRHGFSAKHLSFLYKVVARIPASAGA